MKTTTTAPTTRTRARTTAPLSVPLLLLALLFLLCGTAQGSDVFINTADEFINIVSLNDNSGTTIFLNADIDFTGKTLNPSTNYKGSFNGQGHVISNLRSTSSSQYGGLFGWSSGTTIQNLVVADSCSVGSSYTSGDAYIGGIIGWCQTTQRACLIENIVNMGSVTFSVNLPSDLHFGGIAGVMMSTSYDVTMKNCINYGTVTHRGTVKTYFDMGGIVGHAIGKTIYIQNCINYGTIQYSGTTINGKFIGGIVGNVAGGDGSEKTITIENCLSAGKITSNEISTIGSIAGVVDGNTNTDITHSFWTSDTGQSSACGVSDSSITLAGSYTVELNTGTLNEMNSYAANKGWGKSYVLHLNGGKINGLSQDTLVATGKPFPSPVKEGNSFKFWCTDKDCNGQYNPSSSSSGIDLYAAWSTSTVTFNFGNGTVNKETINFGGGIVYPKDTEMIKEGYTFNGWSPKPGKVTGYDVTVTAQWNINSYNVRFDLGDGTIIERTLKFKEAIVYPKDSEVTREGYSFKGWDRNDKSVPANDLVITAKWTANEYTVTFDVNEGNELTVKEIIVTFDNKYGVLPEASKEGYKFIGWFDEKNEIVTNESTVKIPKNHTLVAQWTNKNYTITFNFGNGTAVENILEFGGSIPYPENGDMTKEGHTFNGWDEDYENMPASDLTITAQWIPNEYTVTFDVNGGDELTEDDRKVVFDSGYGELPEPNRTGYTFAGWFDERNEEITSETIVKVPKNHTLYAQWSRNNYTITFDFGNGTVIEGILDFEENITYPVFSEMKREGYTFTEWDKDDEVMPADDLIITAKWVPNIYTVVFNFVNGTVAENTFEFGKEIVYPDNSEMVKEGYTFVRWDRNDKFVPANNLTITAQWLANEYTVTLDVNGGNELDVKEITVTFDKTYGDLPAPSKVNKTFVGWFNEKNESVTSNSSVKIPRNHVLHAEWKEVPKNQVEIVFGSKDLTEEEINNIIIKYTDGEFTIVRFESNNGDETRIIIKFNDAEQAESFVESIKESSEATNGLIKNIGYNTEVASFSPAICPFFLFF